jgi:ABC-type glucose/galactose transport system permease subunit
MERKVLLNNIYEKVGNLFILIIMVIIFSMLSISFFKFQNLINILRQVSSTAIVTVGFTYLSILPLMERDVPREEDNPIIGGKGVRNTLKKSSKIF